MQKTIKASELVIVNNLAELETALARLADQKLSKPCITTPAGSINYMGFQYIQEMVRQAHLSYDFTYDIFMLRLNGQDNVFYESIMNSLFKHIIVDRNDLVIVSLSSQYNKTLWQYVDEDVELRLK